MLAAAVIGLSPSVSPALASPVTVTAARQQAEVVIDKITPYSVRTRVAPITLSGTVKTDHTSLRVRLRWSNQRLGNRAELDMYAKGLPGAPVDKAHISSTLQLPVPTPGQATPWSISVTPVQLELTSFGVYPLSVEVLDPAGTTLAVQRTFLPYFPSGQSVQKTRISWLLPIVDQPHQSTDGKFVGNTLHKSIAKGGRLSNLLQAVENARNPTPLTWLIDPAVLDDVSALGRDHEIKSERRGADPAGATWLDRLRGLAAESTVAGTPYADADVAALARHGLDAQTKSAFEIGAETVRRVLGKPAAKEIAWPVGGYADHDTLDSLAAHGVRTVVLNENSLPAAPRPAYTPEAATTVPTVYGPMKALLADSALSQLVAGDVRAPGAAALTLQRFLAETAMITAEMPNLARGVVITPPRRWNPNPQFLTALLDASGSVPWLRQVPLTAQRPLPKGTATPRGSLTYTAQNQATELNRPYMRQVARMARSADLTVAVNPEQPPRFKVAVLRMASSAWRGRTSGSVGKNAVCPTRTGRVVAICKTVDQAIQEQIKKIRITSDRPPTLAGANGTLPISISNLLDYKVVLRLKVTSSDPERLRITTPPAEAAGTGPHAVSPSGGPVDLTDDVQIEKRNSQTVPIQLNALADGDTDIVLQLTTLDGTPYGEPVRVTVKATGYTAIALVIASGAVAVMLLSVGARILRRRQKDAE
ncbi:DUF6049 family protein [Rhizohabitans arisaemae]|uniref:DUF6049 family protein n=1 Tax=Rhizohabitans arisaemae TaxID=2720610 RepID=UPI0024B1CCAD|nr:DUF6049 family protein [Rhizohabitans arisaemae]